MYDDRLGGCDSPVVIDPLIVLLAHDGGRHRLYRPMHPHRLDLP